MQKCHLQKQNNTIKELLKGIYMWGKEREKAHDAVLSDSFGVYLSTFLMGAGT